MLFDILEVLYNLYVSHLQDSNALYNYHVLLFEYAILHSCGYYRDIIEDIIDDMKFDGRHSYEDKIVPVEVAYKELKQKIAVLGGLDIDFLSRAQPEKIYQRAKDILSLTKHHGAYALGSGNSVPDYISNDNYLAMLKAAYDMGELS